MMQNGLQKAISVGNLSASGVVIALLVSALQTLNAYNAEFSKIRDNIRLLQNQINSASTEMDARLNVVELQQRQMKNDLNSLQRLAADPRPAPGVWTDQEGRAAVSEIKAWVHEQMADERIRRIGSGPISLHSLIEIQRAIAKISTTDQSGWTKDGKPRVEALKVHLGRPLSEAERDRAWSVLQVMEGLQR